VDILPKKKKVVITVKPHTIHVGGEKKPNNGGQGTETPLPITSLKKPLWKRCLEVIREDITRKKIETGAILKDPNQKWEEYLRFIELTKGEKKP